MTAHYNHHPIHSFLVFQRLYWRTFDSLLVYSKVCELCNHCRLGRQKRRELDIFCPKKQLFIDHRQGRSGKNKMKRTSLWKRSNQEIFDDIFKWTNLFTNVYYIFTWSCHDIFIFQPPTLIFVPFKMNFIRVSFFF